MRILAIMIGSDSDLPQCIEGFAYLLEMKAQGKVAIVSTDTDSIHRHHDTTIENLCDHANLSRVDGIIAGAGMAAHLPGMLDSFARYQLRNDKVVIYAVAFEGKTEEETLAAILSIEKVPGHQMVFTREHVGSDGFLLACKKAVEEPLPLITVKNPPPHQKRSIEQVYQAAISMVEKSKKEISQ